MQQEIVEQSDENQLNLTPHELISSFIRVPTKSQATKLIEEIQTKFDLQHLDAETIVTAAANTVQLKDAIQSPVKFHLGRHTYTYIEVDVVTWRILPSPENVRFEDQRFGIQGAPRFSSLSGSAPVLTFHTDSLKKLIEDLEVQASDIFKENPHTKTIQYRGIEVGGWLSLSRIMAKDMAQPVGVLDATDGFSRTVGAHFGLKVSPRDTILAFSNPVNELKFRSSLVDLREKSASGVDIGAADETRLRCSVMRRAKIIVGYEYRAGASAETPTFDKARRTLVGHLHMSPQHHFSQSAESASKANAIRETLEFEGFVPSVNGLSDEQSVESLAGNIESWLAAGLSLDEYAVFILEAYKPALNSRQGRAIKSSIEDLTGQVIKREELADIAAEVALRPIVIARNMQKVQTEQLMTGLRSILSKTWNISLFSGVKYTQRSLEEVRDAAVQELQFEIANFSSSKGQSNASRAELAAMASFTMVALLEEPLLKRAVGRAGYGNNDEPSKVISELLKSEFGILQLYQIVRDHRDGNVPRAITLDTDPAGVSVPVVSPAGSLASVDTIRSIYVEPENSVTMVDKTPTELINEGLRDLNGKLHSLLDLTKELGAVETDSGVKIVMQDGLAVEQEIAMIVGIMGDLQTWNSMAKAKYESRTQKYSED